MNDRPDEIVRPTRQRMRRAPGFDELTETQSGGVTRKTGAVRVWCPLEDIYRKGSLTEEQYQAGQKYYADWYIGFGASAGTTMRWSEYISGLTGTGDLDAAERRVFHQRRFKQAEALLKDLKTNEQVYWLIIYDIPAEAIGRRFDGYKGKHSASSNAVGKISVSLQLLAKFYGIAK